MVPPLGGIWGPALARVARTAVFKAGKALRAKLVQSAREAAPVLIPVRAAVPRQPIPRAALLRQARSRAGAASQHRWHSTSSGTSAYRNVNAAVRRFFSTGSLAEEGFVSAAQRARFARASATGRAVAASTGRAPFASALRPNLTGGALPRTAGGYGIPGSGRVGGARFFSHAPASQAQVVQNVSSAVRAFWLSGHKAQFDGLTPRGERRYRCVSAMRDDAARKLAARSSFGTPPPGSFVDFRLNPTVTALSPLAASAFSADGGDCGAALASATTLNKDGFIDVLSGDFARALQDMTAVLADIRRLSALGDLPVQLVDVDKGRALRVRFPGVDADTVEALVADLGLVRAGPAVEDKAFAAAAGVPVALRFPFAPGPEATDNNVVASRRAHDPTGGARRRPWQPTASPATTITTDESLDEEMEDIIAGFGAEVTDNPWLLGSSSPSVSRSPSPTEGEERYYAAIAPVAPTPELISSGSQEDYEGLEGVYRFIEECDRARGRF